MIFKAKDIRSSLEKKGFHRKYTDHEYFIFYFQGKKTSIRTKLSLGIKEVGDAILNRMAQQLHLSRKDFNNLIQCPLTYDHYIAILKEKGILD
ncbi:conserved hypothetical protein [Kyrpidia tusciae DSM 2912]|uniref:YcfA family protein n=1 Tax=Kyrpidia tusciae (strain DSM 2912 / NBRC 15312 / T2) TaxID=562970 RepID=D5WVZ9_KYRT2|nr:conserved hypothetical protein [Kyrpidia tusciae DSM 2912]